MPPRLAALAAGAFALLVFAPTASADLIAGEADGVTVHGSAHGYVLRFDKRAARTYRRIAGRRIIVGCSTVTRVGDGYDVSSSGSGTMRAPRRRGRIRTLEVGRDLDFCSVRLRRGRELVAAAPISEAGRTYLDEFETAVLLDVPFEISADPDAPLSTADAVARGGGLIVALPGPDASPPHGNIGYWSEGTRAVAVAVTRKGRRLFLETDRDVLRTNVLRYLSADF